MCTFKLLLNARFDLNLCLVNRVFMHPFVCLCLNISGCLNGRSLTSPTRGTDEVLFSSRPTDAQQKAAAEAAFLLYFIFHSLQQPISSHSSHTL